MRSLNGDASVMPVSRDNLLLTDVHLPDKKDMRDFHIVDEHAKIIDSDCGSKQQCRLSKKKLLPSFSVGQKGA